MFGSRNFSPGINIAPSTGVTLTRGGDVKVESSDGKAYFYNSSASTQSAVVTETHLSQGTARLQNKDLDDTTTSIVDSSDTTKKIKFNAAGTTGTTTTLTGSQTADRVLTLPDATDTLVGKATTDSLTNKSLVDTSTAITDASDATKKILFDAGGTTGTTTTLTAAQTANRVITFPDATTTVVGTDVAQTLTNKTITIADANLTIQDNGDATKQAKFEASSITAGQTRTYTLPDASTTLMGTDNTATFTNKTFSTASNTIQSGAALSGQVLSANGSGGTSWATPTSAPDQSYELSNLGLAASVSASALTITLTDKSGAAPSGSSIVKMGFRNSTAATGDYTIASVSSSVSLVISSGSTLGHRSGVAEYIYVYAFYTSTNTVALAALTEPIMFDQGTVQSSTAEGGAGAADSRIVAYSTAAQTSRPVRLIGRMTSNQTTAGTYASVPTEISLNPFETSPLRISLMAQTRVTGAAPTALGEYRSQLRNANNTTFTDTNGTPTATPSTANGFRIYNGNAFNAADTNAEPTHYDIFVGRNRFIQWEFYSTTGRTGGYNASPIGNISSVDYGYLTSYDPTTGIASITGARFGGTTTTHSSGFDSNGAVSQDPYFDIVVHK